MKNVINRKTWTLELGSEQGISVVIFFVFGFVQRDRQNSQNANAENFCRLPVTRAQCLIGIGTYPDTGILITYDDKDFFQDMVVLKKTS